MSKNVKINNAEYNGVSTIQLNTTSGGTALFQDVDEFNGSAIETQVVSCDTTIGANGGLKFNHSSGGTAVYVGIPDSLPSNTSLVVNRYPLSIVVNVLADDTIAAAALGWAKTGVTVTATLEDGVITISGDSTSWLTNAEVQFTFWKIPTSEVSQ